MNRTLLEQQLAQLPLLQYEFFSTDELSFSQRVRHICETECPMYNRTWACPPAVGSVEECRQRVLSYPHGLMISSAAEVNDATNLQETLATRGDHEALARQVRDWMREQGLEVYVLSTEACALCESCAWPDSPCRHPDRMFPCVESHGILVTALAERYGIEFLAAGNMVTWYSLLLYREAQCRTGRP